jgi:hypothetical protein
VARGGRGGAGDRGAPAAPLIGRALDCRDARKDFAPRSQRNAKIAKHDCRDHTLKSQNSEGFERVIEKECFALFALFAPFA